jgi:hypothetical protein
MFLVSGLKFLVMGFATQEQETMNKELETLLK